VAGELALALIKVVRLTDLVRLIQIGRLLSQIRCCRFE
jgi:hypothetical protein